MCFSPGSRNLQTKMSKQMSSPPVPKRRHMSTLLLQQSISDSMPRPPAPVSSSLLSQHPMSMPPTPILSTLSSKHPVSVPSTPVLSSFLSQQMKPTPIPVCSTGYNGQPRFCGHDASAEFEGQVVNRAVTDMSTVFDEVFSVQRGQSNEIQRLQKALQHCKEINSAEEVKQKDLQEELSCVINKGTMLDEGIIETNRSIRNMAQDIQQLIVKLHEEQVTLNCRELDIEEETRRLQCYKDRMETFSEEVIDYERTTSSIQQQLHDVTENIKQLEAHEAAMDDEKMDLVEKKLASKIERLKVKLLEAGDDVKQKISKRAEEQKKRSQFQQSIQVLNKKNAALLTRLKKQVKDLVQRNRHKQNQVTQLEKQLGHASNKLDQFTN